MNILSADNLHILSQRNEKLHSMWTITIDDHTCHDEVLLMIQRAFHDPDAFIEKLFHDHSLPAVKDVCVCVRSASGFLRYLSSIVEDPFLIWAKCERNENASSLQDMAKKICPHTKIQIMSALCDNPRILSLPSPCHVQDHSHSGIVGGMGSRHVRYMKALLACDVLTFSFCEHHRATNPGGRNGCVFDSRWDIVKFCPAKPGVPVWSILSLRDENFCSAGCHCQCFIFMHLLHPNPTPNSTCLEPSWRHVNQTSSPCYWTCRHRCGQFHSRRTGCGNILAQLFEIVVQMVNGLDRREQSKSNCGWKLNWAFIDIERWLYNIDIYFAPLFMFLVPLVHFL